MGLVGIFSKPVNVITVLGQFLHVLKRVFYGLLRLVG